jgi:cytoskeletal protein CcmA (bactofilin family)
MNNYMFGDKKNKIKDSERSLISETVSIEGTINSSGAIDVAGLIKGPVISKEIVVRETGSVTGSIEGDTIEIHGHMNGKISGDEIIIGATGTVKGDIEFANNLRTENGADIDGYIKKTHGSKSKLKPDFLFSKSKEEKKTKENGGSEAVLNKDSEFLA